MHGERNELNITRGWISMYLSDRCQCTRSTVRSSRQLWWTSLSFSRVCHRVNVLCFFSPLLTVVSGGCLIRYWKEHKPGLWVHTGFCDLCYRIEILCRPEMDNLGTLLMKLSAAFLVCLVDYSLAQDETFGKKVLLWHFDISCDNSSIHVGEISHLTHYYTISMYICMRGIQYFNGVLSDLYNITTE